MHVILYCPNLHNLGSMANIPFVLKVVGELSLPEWLSCSMGSRNFLHLHNWSIQSMGEKKFEAPKPC